MTFRTRAVVVIVVGLAVGGLTGCTATGPASSATLTPVPARTGAPYSATLSGIPLTLLRPAALSPQPNAKSANFLSFPSTGNANDDVRVLIPTTVCLAGSTTPGPIPSDYVAYLHSQAAFGATIKNEDSISIDGVSGTELTIGGTRDIPGSIGQSQGAGCGDADSFGVASDLSLRMAIFTVRNKTVLIWARTDANHPTAGFFNTFQKMLQTVTFS